MKKFLPFASMESKVLALCIKGGDGNRHRARDIQRSMLLLLLLSSLCSTHAWHAALGKRAAPIMNSTTQLGALEMPRVKDMMVNERGLSIVDPCAIMTMSVRKLHFVCSKSCETAMPCDWNCKAAWNSFLRDAHFAENKRCASYEDFLRTESLSSLLVPALSPAKNMSYVNTNITTQYLTLLVNTCQMMCPQDARDGRGFPCGEFYTSDSFAGSKELKQGNYNTIIKCNSERRPSFKEGVLSKDGDDAIPACYPLAPPRADCIGGRESFRVTDGTFWYPFVTWGVVTHYKLNNQGESGGLHSTSDSLEKNEYSSYACIYEESCAEMLGEREGVAQKMACFRYSHLRGEFHWWKWSTSAADFTYAYLTQWVAYASFCSPGERFEIIDARDPSVKINPRDVSFSFSRMQRNYEMVQPSSKSNLYRMEPALTGNMSESFGPNGCSRFKLQSFMNYQLEIKVGNGDTYFTHYASWGTPRKADMAKLVKYTLEFPITVPLYPKQNIECSSLVFILSWCSASVRDMDLVLFKVNSVSRPCS